MMTARVSRTWSSTRCSITGIFLSSSGLKIVSCSHLFSELRPLDIRSVHLMASRDRLASERSRLASYVLLGIDRDKQVIPLPAQEQDGQLVFFQLTRGVLIVFERFHDLVVHFLNHIATLQTSRFRRAAALDRRHDHA